MPGADSGFMIGNKKMAFSNDHLSRAQEIMKRFKMDDEDSMEGEDPASYLKLNNKRVKTTN